MCNPSVTVTVNGDSHAMNGSVSTEHSRLEAEDDEKRKRTVASLCYISKWNTSGYVGVMHASSDGA